MPDTSSEEPLPQSEAELSEADARMHGFSASKDGQRVDPKDLRPQWTMVVCSVCRTPWEVDGGPMCDHDDAETAEMTVVEVDADAEPEHQERSAMAKLAALRERLGVEADGEAELDADLQALAAEVRKHAPVLSTRGGFEERLWAALDRSVLLLEGRLSLIESTTSAFSTDLAALNAYGSTVRNIAETMDRLGLLEPPPPPVEETEHDVSEVWVTASEAGFSTEQCDRLVVRLRERYEGRA